MTEDYQNFLNGLGLALRKARLKNGFTQAELGKKTGRNQSAIYKLERGPAHGVPLNVLFEVASAIPVSLAELISEAEKYVAQNQKANKDSSVLHHIETLPNHSREAVERIIGEVLTLIPAAKGKDELSN